MPKAPEILKFNEQERLRLFEVGRDLFGFCHVLLGMKDLNAPTHRERCKFIQNLPPGALYLICEARGTLKSVVSVIGQLPWRSIYEPNFSTLVVEQKADNAYRNHIAKIDHIFRNSAQSTILQWVYEDYLPNGFDGWNQNQINFLVPKEFEEDPFREPSITYGGIDSAFEGKHVNMVLTDDPEGADAEKRMVHPADARRFVYQRATPLLMDPSKGRIGVVATPHGTSPIVWEIREKEADFRHENNGQKMWHIRWVPAIDANGEANWPERYPLEKLKVIEALDKDMFDQQFMLRKRRAGDLVFNMSRIREHQWEWASKGELIRYTKEVWSPLNVDSFGVPLSVTKTATISPNHLAITMHGDPKHKGEKIERGTSRAAISVCGANYDGHEFVLETWVSDSAGLEEFAEMYYHLYRKWCPRIATMEAVGAQVWFWDYGRKLEETKYRDLHSLPRNGQTHWLPSLVGPKPAQGQKHLGRLREANKKNASKEPYIIEQLSPWYNFGVLHNHAEQTELDHELSVFPNPSEPMDLLDTLAQGPSVWKSPIGQKEAKEFSRLDMVEMMKRKPDKVTGYFPREYKMIAQSGQTW